jgi:hypothetical protein
LKKISGAAAISSSFGLKAAPHRQHLGVGKVRLILEPTEMVQSAIGKRATILAVAWSSATKATTNHTEPSTRSAK